MNGKKPAAQAAEGSSDKRSKSVRTAGSTRHVLSRLGLSFGRGWLTCSTAIVLVNRAIIMEEFPHPIALSALGQCTSFLFAGMAVWSSSGQRSLNPGEKHITQPIPPMTWTFWLTRVVPVGMASGIGIWLSNLLYLLLTVAFIEMARSLLPLLTLLALWGTRLKIPGNQQIAAVLLSALGCGISAYGEAKLVPLGMFCLGLSFALEIIRMVLLQYLMQDHQLGPWQTVWTVAGPASGTLLVLMVALEGTRMVEMHAGRVVLKYWPAFFLAATLGAATSYVTLLVIQLSSATTVKLLAAIRGPLIVMCGMLLYAEPVAPLQLVGYSVALCGFVWYSLAPAKEMPRPNPQLAPEETDPTQALTQSGLSPDRLQVVKRGTSSSGATDGTQADKPLTQH